jgi:hypothetical protein
MVHARSAGPQLYSWTVIDQVGDPPLLGALGVCDDRQRALSRLSEALREAPAGARGVVHKVTVSLAEVGYWYDEVIALAEFDAATGAVVHRDVGPQGGWGRLNTLLSGAS